MPIVYTGGTFDLFHSGHANFLKRCAEIGDVVVSLNTDEFIKKYKGSSPIILFEDRKAVLESCKYVSKVIPNIGNEDSKITISLVKPDYVVIGSDWARKDYYSQMNFTQDWLDNNNIGLVYIPYTDGISSTKIKSLMKKDLEF